MSQDSTFKRVMDGVNNRKPSVEERVEHAKLKAQTHETLERAKAEAEKNARALKAMDRRSKN